MASPQKGTAPRDEEQKPASPSVSLPKGGGAIKGLGEKFAANPVTGTGSMSVPIATSPGRSGFGPQLSLSYDSGSGNGHFGFGWSLSLPQITRKTDKGLPRYLDGRDKEPDSDVFILSGAEDLVPELEKDSNGEWVIKCVEPRTVDVRTYQIRRYRRRIEDLFSRIEHWTCESDPTDVRWRSISKDNITTWYGKTENSRIFDPNDKSRIFSWLICESHDEKGNVIVYGYKPEYSQNIFKDTQGNSITLANERNRTEQSRAANRYLKRIRYGNDKPYLPKISAEDVWPSPPGATVSDGSKDWLFEVIFDYGEHDADVPQPDDDPAHSNSKAWRAREDPFSSYRAGFEVRSYRLCQRVLMFHHIPDLPTGEKGYDGLVRSTEFSYSQSAIGSFISSVTQSGYVRRDDGTYLKK